MTRTIASIYFEECDIERPLYKGKFHLDAVPRGGKPFLLTVHDHTQFETMPYVLGRKQVRNQILGETIAQDIVDHWSRKALGMTVDCGPGIWVVRDWLPEVNPDGTLVLDEDKRPVMREASETERKAMWEEDLARAVSRQDKWCAYNIQQGDILADEPKKRILITPTMRNCAIYAMRDVAWLKEIKATDMKKCPFCHRSVEAGVSRCPHCNDIIDQALYQQKKSEIKAQTIPAA